MDFKFYIESYKINIRILRRRDADNVLYYYIIVRPANHHLSECTRTLIYRGNRIIKFIQKKSGCIGFKSTDVSETSHMPNKSNRHTQYTRNIIRSMVGIF